jgi:ribosome biogenesis GTPase
MKRLYTNLIKYGLSANFEQEAAAFPNLLLARITEQHRGLYKLISESRELYGKLTGKLQYEAASSMDFPAVGDWVMIDKTDDSSDAVIHRILPRKSLFMRKEASTKHDREQVIAANIDTVFICMSLNSDFSLRRIERYLTIAWDSMATPVIVLTKSDLCIDLDEKLNEINTVAFGVDVVVCSSELTGGLDTIRSHITSGETIAFVGSSGVGKSTLINRLAAKEILATGTIREDDDKGRHTTTARQLIVLPDGGIVIDTPGMREIGIYSGDLSKTFEDVEELALRCKFSNCTHTTEPGCVVNAAINSGELSEKRYENFLKLKREIAYEGLSSRQLENEKINRMYGSKSAMKKVYKSIKERKK